MWCARQNIILYIMGNLLIEGIDDDASSAPSCMW